MESIGNYHSIEEIKDELESGASPNAPKLREFRIRVPTLRIPSLRARMLDEQTLNQPIRRRRLLDFLKARPSIEWFKKIRFSSPLAIFRRTVDEREEISLSVPSPVGIHRRFNIQFIRKINWASLFNICKRWLRHPMNIALLLWLICVAAFGAMLGLLLLGLLTKAFPTTSSRNMWVEINNQVLNALFTLMSIYQHPTLFHHLVMLFRWSSEDITELRKTYCKNAAYRPHEWAHIMVVLALLHITCFSQYALCGLYWGYTSETRSELLENLCFALGTASPVFAALYTVYSPLGREYDTDSDEESQIVTTVTDVKQANKLGLKLYSRSRRALVSQPEWVGGLFDCSQDVTVGYLSFFCTCCVFGWNMERLGFGNMYVHIVTFFLLCVAPFWIFNISALNIHNHVLGDVIGIMGIVLCVCGLIYGGFWRIQMRKRFKLPGSKFCCGSASMTDYIQWLFCWSCSLAQEVRTGNFYDVEDDSLYRRLLTPRGGTSPLMRSDRCSTPLPASFMAGSPTSIVIIQEVGSSSLAVEEESPAAALDDTMTPPVPPLIKSDDGVGEGDVVDTLTKLEDGTIDGDTVPPSPSSSSTQTEDRVGDGNIVAPLIQFEDRVDDGDTVAELPSLPLIQTEDNFSSSIKLVKFVKVMQYGLFIVIVYTLGATLLR